MDEESDEDGGGLISLQNCMISLTRADDVLRGFLLRRCAAPFIAGMSVVQKLDISHEENARLYRESQQQRYMERRVRAQKTKADALVAAGDTAGARAREMNRELKSWCQEKGRAYYAERVRVTRGEAVKGSKPGGLTVPGDTGLNFYLPNFEPAARRIDYAAADSFAQGDTRLINMLRTGTPTEVAEAVNEILTLRYKLAESKWSHMVQVIDNLSAINYAAGSKNSDCSISVFKNLMYDVGLYVHENAHSRSISWFLDKDFVHKYLIEEGSVEYLIKAICDENGITHELQYRELVGALISIQHIVAKDMTPVDFAVYLIDINLPRRYNRIERVVAEYKLNNANLSPREAEQLDKALRVLRGGGWIK